MKLTLAITIAMLGLLVPASADAHTLSLTRAENFAQEIARDGYLEDGWGQLPVVSDWTVYGCQRVSAHTVDCDYGLYVDETEEWCNDVVRVRYKSNRSYGLGNSFPYRGFDCSVG